jgi:hypothetical protein
MIAGGSILPGERWRCVFPECASVAPGIYETMLRHSIENAGLMQVPERWLHIVGRYSVLDVRANNAKKTMARSMFDRRSIGRGTCSVAGSMVGS